MTLFRPIVVFDGTNNILQNILSFNPKINHKKRIKLKVIGCRSVFVLWD